MYFLNKKVHLLVSELYIYQNVRCKNKKNCLGYLCYKLRIRQEIYNLHNGNSVRSTGQVDLTLT